MSDNPKNAATLPSWMQQPENYIPQKDQEQFLRKSTLKILSVLSKVRQNGSTAPKSCSAFLKLFYTIMFIVLVSCSTNMFFTYVCLALVLGRICFLPGSKLKAVILPALVAAALTALVLLPSVFLGTPRTMLTVSLKVLFSVCLVNILAVTTAWNRITEGLRFYFIPNIFVFTFDITLKYIVLLGTIAGDVLTAVRLRSVGKNKKKGASLSGVLGITFLKSKEMSEEMHGAMMCRGFDGTYQRPKHYQFRWMDLVAVLMMLAVIGGFIYFQRAM